MTACVEDDVSIPWSFTTSPAETVVDIMWFLEKNDEKREMFASLTDGEFFSHLRQHVQFVASAGVRLQNVTVNDTGLYSVHVNIVDSEGHVTKLNRSAFVEVEGPPALSGDQLLARRRMAPVRDDVTGAWHMILECGQFTYLGKPPVSVKWTTPSGAVSTEVNYQDGYFLLPLQHVETGNYTCSLIYLSPARQCFSNDSTLAGVATVYVDKENVKWAVVEANQWELIAEGQILRQENQELKSQVENITTKGQILQQENEELKSQVQNLTQRMNQLEHAISLQVRHPASCVDVKLRGGVSGVYTLFEGLSTITVFCDQDTDGGGWTVFQRRQDGSVNFFLNWVDYRSGFGNLVGEFWLGLDNLHVLTSSRRYELRVDLEAFNGTRVFATYSGFRVEDINTNYTLFFDDFLDGNAGDSLTYHKEHGFSTQDYGNSTGCAKTWHGGWWYNNCYRANLNGIYRPISQMATTDGINWEISMGVGSLLKRTEMKIRPM